MEGRWREVEGGGLWVVSGGLVATNGDCLGMAWVGFVALLDVLMVAAFQAR